VCARILCLASLSTAGRIIGSTLSGVLATALACVAGIASADPEPRWDHHLRLTPENSAIGNFPSQKRPVLTIRSGDTVKFDTGGGARWTSDQGPEAWLREHGVDISTNQACLAETMRVLAETPRWAGITNGHLLLGPVAIENAEPGDSIEVRILSVRPRIPYGTVGAMPGRGGLPDKVPRPFTKVVHLDLVRNVGVFEPGVEVALGPFMGVMGTLPPSEEGPNRKSGPPGRFGGNLDCKELVAGTSLFLPVFHRGGLFFTGDAHAAQGDGEVTVNAIETANTAILKFILHKGRTLSAPRAESPTHHIAFGLDPDLDQAMRMAIEETTTLLSDLRGWDFFRAYTFASIAVDFRVTQVVDGTKGIHAMVPKKAFPKNPDRHWLTPAEPR
jgi:acetamidase/formamidase